MENGQKSLGNPNIQAVNSETIVVNKGIRSIARNVVRAIRQKR